MTVAQYIIRQHIVLLQYSKRHTQTVLWDGWMGELHGIHSIYGTYSIYGMYVVLILYIHQYTNNATINVLIVSVCACTTSGRTGI